MSETPREAARRLAGGAVGDGFKPQALHEYTDASGKPLFWRIRLKHPNFESLPQEKQAHYRQDKWIRPMRLNGKGYEIGEPAFSTSGKPIYRMHKLAASPDAPVELVEGELCTDALERLGVLATTSGGCGSTDAADFSPLAGRTVRIWPDNDEPGQRYAAEVATKLQALGCAVSLVDVAKLGLPPKGDAVDWLAAHPEAKAADVRALPTVEAAAEWPEPQPLPEISAVPPFPVEILPDDLQAWAADAAERAQFPVDYAAVSAMVALGSVIGRKLGIRLKARDDWTEYGNVWGANVGPPSALKSPASRAALRPFKALQAAADAAHAEAMEEHAAAGEAHKARRDAKRKATVKALAKNPDAEIDLGEPEPEAPVARTYWTSNVNEASLGALLAANPNGLLLERDELSSLLASLEDDGKADLRGMLLACWSGNEGYRFDRILRGTISIPKAALSILGGIQPGPLDRYVRNAFSGERADGMLQRFQLLVWPDAGSFEHVDRWAAKDAKDKARALFERADTLDPLAIGAKDDLGDDPPYVRLSDEAQAVFNAWYVPFMRARRTIEADGSESGSLSAHFGKYPGLLGKLALIIHVADEPHAKRVSERTMRKALAWLDYLAPHARRVYHAAEFPETGAARLLLARIQQGKLPDQFKAWEVTRNCWHGLTDRASVKKACRLLFEYGWLIEIDPGGSTGGRPADPLYAVSPAVKSESFSPKHGTAKTAQSTLRSLCSSDPRGKNSHFEAGGDDYVEVAV